MYSRVGGGDGGTGFGKRDSIGGGACGDGVGVGAGDCGGLEIDGGVLGDIGAGGVDGVVDWGGGDCDAVEVETARGDAWKGEEGSDRAGGGDGGGRIGVGHFSGEVVMTTLCANQLLRATEAVSSAAFAAIRQRMVLEYCKFNPQVGDAGTLAPFALVMQRQTWDELALLAERLGAETLAAEKELVRRPALWEELGVPRRMRRLLARGMRRGFSPSGGRVMRFDFHATREGWRISEVNSDVPGGYSEAWHWSRLMAEELGGGLVTAGDPGEAWARAIARAAKGERVGLICAPGYMEDRQVVMQMARGIREAGCEAVVIDLRQIVWREERAGLEERGTWKELGVVVRFYQAEWLVNLPRRFGWRNLFVGGRTPVTNPAAAVLTENKGFPLVWDALETQVPTWRELLPETRVVGGIVWRRDRRWVLKGRYSNNGDAVVFGERADARMMRKLGWQLWWAPREWVVQRRFEAMGVEPPVGEVYPCVGVYVVEGRAVGMYGRISHGPVVDFGAMDVAMLIEEDGE